MQGVRFGIPTRPAAARALLDALGWERLGALGSDLRQLIATLEQSAADFRARVLVVAPDQKAGLCLGVNVIDGDRPGIVGIDSVDLVMESRRTRIAQRSRDGAARMSPSPATGLR
jgi:hypothetical protein